MATKKTAKKSALKEILAKRFKGSKPEGEETMKHEKSESPSFEKKETD